MNYCREAESYIFDQKRRDDKIFIILPLLYVGNLSAAAYHDTHKVTSKKSDRNAKAMTDYEKGGMRSWQKGQD